MSFVRASVRPNVITHVRVHRKNAKVNSRANEYAADRFAVEADSDYAKYLSDR